jgi:hypothetical protein
MRTDPGEFTSVIPIRANRRAMAPRISKQAPAKILDAAFADYSRIDAGLASSDGATDSRASAAIDAARLKDWRSVTRDIVSDIAAQLDTLERQREELSRLLQTVDIGVLTD